MVFIANEIKKDPRLVGVIGLQFCNVTFRDDDQRHAWQSKLLEQLSLIDPSLPAYIDDGNNLENALKWSLGRNVLRGKRDCPVIINTRRSYIVDDAYKQLSPNQLISSIPDELYEINHHNSGSITDNNGAVAVYVGEFSCAMSIETRNKSPKEQRDNLTIQFGRYQTRRWQEKTGGSAFWAWNAGQLRDKSFDFGTQIDKGSIYCPPQLLLIESQVRQKLMEADAKRSQCMTVAMERHIAYFEKIGGRYEHWRYADGWHLGFTDARAFFASRLDLLTLSRDKSTGGDPVIGADKISALDLWGLKRMREENSVSRDRCELVWEWEHGFRAGIKTFYRLVGIQT